jgi:carbonic anhydrase/acetyltransferase-like protein (isoleucine patch superfamily)
MAIYSLGGFVPTIHPSAYVADDATIIGQVTLEANVSVWSGAVLRGDNEPIFVGPGSNIQEGTIIHVDPGHPVHIGAGVTVGHQAMLHGCTIHENTLIGIQSVVLNGAVIARDTLVGACSLITEGKQFEPGVLLMGSPAKVARPLQPEQIVGLQASAQHYIERGSYYKTNLTRIA